MEDILSKLHYVLKEVEEFQADSKDKLERFKSVFIGRKGVVTELFEQMKEVAPEHRKELGQQLNRLKNFAEDRYKSLVDQVSELTESKSVSLSQDLTLPTIPENLGSVHPLTQVRWQIEEIFERMGFNISEGREIEDDWHNFSALNFPPDHPARDMQDTFFIEKNPDILLRTHTSTIQVRVMETQAPPIRTLCIGRVFRNEAISARAHCIFHQIEGLYVDRNVGFADLKQTLLHFVKELFGKNTKIRLRPSYFPFTEPSAELDISCLICKGEGCNMCKHTGWVEIGGTGMVDPNVLKSSGIDPVEFTGFAFGMGLERITNLKYQIRDLRLFTENDVRFLRQFATLS